MQIGKVEFGPEDITVTGPDGQVRQADKHMQNQFLRNVNNTLTSQVAELKVSNEAGLEIIRRQLEVNDSAEDEISKLRGLVGEIQHRIEHNSGCDMFGYPFNSKIDKDCICGTIDLLLRVEAILSDD